MQNGTITFVSKKASGDHETLFLRDIDLSHAPQGYVTGEEGVSVYKQIVIPLSSILYIRED